MVLGLSFSASSRALRRLTSASGSSSSSSAACGAMFLFLASRDTHPGRRRAHDPCYVSPHPHTRPHVRPSAAGARVLGRPAHVSAARPGGTRVCGGRFLLVSPLGRLELPHHCRRYLICRTASSHQLVGVQGCKKITRELVPVPMYIVDCRLSTYRTSLRRLSDPRGPSDLCPFRPLPLPNGCTVFGRIMPARDTLLTGAFICAIGALLANKKVVGSGRLSDTLPYWEMVLIYAYKEENDQIFGQKEEMRTRPSEEML